ncbi:cob(I)yrinic acid a,c-diamide adenosyltransferase [Methylothermus subterraneus]
MRIYTRTGDQGTTGLLGGLRVSKASLRIFAYGSVDELNSVLGMAVSQLQDGEAASWLRAIQNELHILCADLANPDPDRAGPRICAAHVERLEHLCDRLDAELPPLKHFILPGGTFAAALLHFARTVARRAEREVVALAEEEAINPQALCYLNRLSDLLFLLARWVNLQAKVAEMAPWYGDLP